MRGVIIPRLRHCLRASASGTCIRGILTPLKFGLEGIFKSGVALRATSVDGTYGKAPGSVLTPAGEDRADAGGGYGIFNKGGGLSVI